MDRAVRQHEAERALGGGHPFGQPLRAGGVEQHDGGRRTLQGRGLVWIHAAVPSDDVEAAGHQREGLAEAPLALTQARDRRRVGGVAGEVETADALHRQDQALAQPPAGELDRIPRSGARRVQDPSGRILQPHPRAAGGAGVRLGVEAAVGGIAILALAVRTHPESRHAGVGPVVRDGPHDRQARSAVRAVDERVAKSAVARVEEFAPARLAGRRVGNDPGADLSPCTRDDAKTRRRWSRGEAAAVQLRDPRQRRALAEEAPAELVALTLVAPDADQHPFGIVADVAVEPELTGQPPYRRPESHALDQAANADLLTRRCHAGSASVGRRRRCQPSPS